MESFYRKRRRVLLARGQTTDCFNQPLTRNLRGLFHSHAFDHFRERGAADECGRATVSEKARGFDASVADTQSELQLIAADWINLLGASVSILQCSGRTRICEMVFESFRVRQVCWRRRVVRKCLLLSRET